MVIKLHSEAAMCSDQPCSQAGKSEVTCEHREMSAGTNSRFPTHVKGKRNQESLPVAKTMGEPMD